MRKIITKGFTLIEILVVATIISMLSAGAFVSYSVVTKNSRNARRKTDLENIRVALEEYRRTKDIYPTSLTFGTGSLTDDLGNTYMSKIPQDPKSPTQVYYYTSTGADYTLASQLETTSSCASPPGSPNCGTGYACNYCLGPYGQK